MDRRQVGYVLIGLGAALVVLSTLADPIGIGEGGGFGWKQTVGVVVGAVLAAGGAWLLYSRGARRTASES